MPKLVPSFSAVSLSIKGYLKELLAMREVFWIFGTALVLNAVIWAINAIWFYFNPLFLLIGLGIVGMNILLSTVFVRKERVIVQSLAATALVVQVLLLVYVLRMGAFVL